MNVELYNSLAQACAVLKEAEDLRLEIGAQQALMPEEVEPQRLKARLQRFRYEKRRRLGYLFGVIGTLGTLLLLAVLPALIERPDEVVGSVVLLAIVFLPPLLVGGLLLRSYYREKRDLRVSLCKAQERYAAITPARRAEIEVSKARCTELAGRMRGLWEQRGEQLSFLPRGYANLKCVTYMLEKVQSGRATSLRTALYLAERLRTEPAEDNTGEVIADGILDTVLDAIFH